MKSTFFQIMVCGPSTANVLSVFQHISKNQNVLFPDYTQLITLEDQSHIGLNYRFAAILEINQQLKNYLKGTHALLFVIPPIH